MAATPLTSSDEMLDLAQRLIEEFADLPAGSVLRCLARSVRRAQSWNCPPAHLLSVVEASTRWTLAHRGPATNGVIPAQRLGDRAPQTAGRLDHELG